MRLQCQTVCPVVTGKLILLLKQIWTLGSRFGATYVGASKIISMQVEGTKGVIFSLLYHGYCRKLTQSSLEIWTPQETCKLTSFTPLQVNWNEKHFFQGMKSLFFCLTQTTCGRRWWLQSWRESGRMCRWRQTTRLSQFSSSGTKTLMAIFKGPPPLEETLMIIFKGRDYTASLTAGNPDLLGGTGMGVAHYLQVLGKEI